MDAKFYDVHVFISRKEGCSIPIKIEIDTDLDDDQVIAHAAENKLFVDDDDKELVDYVEEITEQEYNDMKNC